MTWIASVFGVLVSCGFILAGAVMNWRYGLGIGRTPSDQYLNASVHALIDACKVMLPFFGWWAWDRSRYLVASMCVVATVSCIGYSAVGIAGFVDMSMSVTSDNLTTTKDDVKAWRDEIARSERRLGEIGSFDPASVTEKKIEQRKQDLRWSTSKQCSDATAKISREFCVEVRGLETELAKAEEATKLERRATALRDKVREQSGIAGLETGDPRSEIVARMTGWKLLQVQTWLSLLYVAIVEFMATFGVFLSLNHGALVRHVREHDKKDGVTHLADVEASPTTQTPPLTGNAGVAEAIEPPVISGRSEAVSVIEHQPVGQIIQFVAERTVPAKGGIELSALHAGYVAWCCDVGARAVDCETFERELDRIRAMPEVGERVSKFGTRYIGIVLTRKEKTRIKRRPR